MAFIKKYNPSTDKWEIISSTNAAGIYTKDKSLLEIGNNVDTVLHNLKEDVDYLKRNVSWLAKYGGGGSGGSGGSAGGVEASIIVNGNPTNSDFTLTSTGINIEIQSSNKKLLWNITVMANNTTLVKGITNATSLFIKQSEWEKVVSQKASLNITAYNAAQLITIYWNGTVNISSIKLECDKQHTGSFIGFEDLSIPLAYILGSTGSYKMYVNDVALDNGRQYNALKGNYNVTCGDINEVLKSAETDFFIVGINKVTFKLENVNAPEVFYEVSTEIILTSADPIIYNVTLSKDQNTPTEIVFYSDPFTINIPFIVYYNSTRPFSYQINYETLDGTKLSNNIFANNIEYNTYVSSASLQLVNIKPETVKIIIAIKDISSTKEYQEVYYAKLTAPESGLLDNPHDEYTEQIGDTTITTTDKIFDFNASNARIDNVGYVWKYDNKLKNEEHIAHINNPNVLCSQIDTSYSLRLQNSAYLKIPMNKTYLTNAGGFLSGKNFGFTLEICYKNDYHPDDERTILQWGSENDLDKDTGLPNRGILIRDHDLYIGAQKIITLIDEEVINICITYYTENFTYANNIFGGSGTYFIYIDGVIEAVGNIETTNILPGGSENIDFYIGASYCEVDGNRVDATNYTDMNLYRFTFYNKCLAPYDVLIDYLNNQATSNFKNGQPDISKIDDGLKRNFITYNESTKTYDSLLYTRLSTEAIGGNNFNNRHDDLSTFFNVNRFVNNGKLSSELSNYTIPIPIVYINIPGWKWTDFISPVTGETADTVLPKTTATFQYYDQQQSDTFNVSNNNSFTVNCSVKPQGTSTLADYIKNLNIIFEEETIFCPKKNWLPEIEYTLKADIVDSSHSINASIGKFINTEFGLIDNGNEFYPFSPTVKSEFLKFKQSAVGKNCFPEVNLKHGVEGFPVFVIIQFADGVKTLGIYQFILGRSSARNLGFEIVTSLTNNGLETPQTDPVFNDDKLGIYNYPLILTSASITTKKIQGVWIEFGQNDQITWDHQALTDKTFAETEFTGPFWQSDAQFYNTTAEIKYSSADNITEQTAVSNITPFMDFVNNIMKMPVVYKRYSTASGVVQNQASPGISYKQMQYNGEGWQVIEGRNFLIDNNNDALAGLISSLPISVMQKYFCIMMLFGLVDNFQKNMPIKIYKNNNGEWEIPILGIYDTDTGCGQNNQAVQDVATSMWFAGLTNSGYNFTEANLGSTYSTPVGISNKMWYIDCNRVNAFGENKNENGSMWASAWYDMLNYLFTNKGIGLLQIANYYFDNYFLKQTEGCGELLFNLTYISKYITKYQDKNGNKTNQIQKLHGRRRHQVKQWLNERVIFLHSLFYAFKPANNAILNEGEQITVAINAALGPRAMITTNAPILIGYTNQGSNTAYSFCQKNIPQAIYFGSTSTQFGSGFSAFSHVLTNPNQIIKIGEGDNPLYDLGFGNINSGSLVYLSDYNCSAPSRDPNNANGLMMMSDDYMSSRFCRTIGVDEDGNPIYRSEIRNIDFRNTYPSQGVSQYVLNLQNGFDKLQTLYVNNSCITGLIFPENISIKDFNIANSNIVTLKLSNQNFITELDVTNCKALQILNINNCLNLRSVNIDATNQSLNTLSILDCPSLTNVTILDNSSIETVYISSPSVESLTIKNCRKLKSVEIAIRPLESIQITNCENFSTLNFIISNNDEETKSIESEKLKVFNVSNTAIQYGGYAIDVKSASKENIVDLYYFKNLTTINFLNCDSVEYIQLHNAPNIILEPNSFNRCTNLKRVYGHYLIKYIAGNNIVGMFKDCKKYSIHGDGTTWKNKTIGTAPVKSPLELLSKTGANITVNDLFASGTRVTNLRLNNTTNRASEFNSAFENTNCSAFDLYYFLNLIAAQINNASITGNISLYREFYNCQKMFSWEKSNNPSNRIFEGCSKITAISSLCSTEPIFLPGPSNNGTAVTADNGIYSPLVNCTSLSQVFVGTCHFSKWLLRRKSSNYKINSLTWWSCGYITDADTTLSYSDITDITKIIAKRNNIGSFSGFFTNLPSLTTLNSVFNNIYINYSTIELPPTIKYCYQSFCSTYGIGILDVKRIFTVSTNNISNIQQISSSFYINNFDDRLGSKVKFYIYEDMFTHTPALNTIGYSTLGTSYGNVNKLAFNGIGLEKVIINSNEYLENDNVVNAITFPYKIFSKLSALQVCSGFFMDVINSNFGENIPCLPGDADTEDSLFANCKYITRCEQLFKNVNFPFTLSPNGFKNRDTSTAFLLSEMFYHDIGETNRSKIQGSIPFNFLYHGSKPSTTAQLTVTTWKPWTSYAYKIEYGVPVTLVVNGDEDTDYQEGSYVRVYNGTETTYKYNGTVCYKNEATPETPFYLSISEIDTGGETTIVYSGLITFDRKTDEIVSTKYNNPSEDPFFNTNNKDINGNPAIPVKEEKYSITYNKVNQYITDVNRMFYGCIGLSCYTDNIDPAIYKDKNTSYIPEKYTWKKQGGKWVEIDHSNPEISCEYTGFWSYNGNPETMKDGYLYLETSKVKSAIDKFDTNKPTGSIAYYPSAKQSTTLSYICPPDLLRYCTNNSTTNVSGLFENCGLNYPKTGNGYMTEQEGTNYFAIGLNGRLCPYMFYNIPSITNIDRMFKFCRCICCYEEDGENYLIPKTFFNYAKNISSFVESFKGMTIQEKTNLKVFGNISNTINLDLRCAFNCLLVCPTSAKSDSFNINAGMFEYKNVLYYSGIFAPYDIIPDITASSSGLVKRVGGTDGYNYVHRFYITYSNMFSTNKVPSQTNAWYVYYKITDDLTNNDTQTKNQNYNV